MPHSVLESLWRSSVLSDSYTSAHNDLWDEQIETLNKLSISMEDTMRYLYSEKPCLADFNSWINAKRKDFSLPQEILDDVLTQQDLAFWETNGYVIVRNAISKQDCETTCNAIWNFLEMKPNDKKSWYTIHKEQRGLMVSFFDHETLNKNRQSLRIRKAYEQLYGTAKIYNNIDKVSFNPPKTEHYTFMGSALHWDVSLKLPIPFALQGLLYLTDCGPNDGAFHCVPGFHSKIEDWLTNLDPLENPRDIALQTLQAVPVIANAGDFIIWNNTLPHCATPNHGTTPRMVQYLTYLPEGYKAATEFI